jgi:hypothetical protein
MPAGKNNSFEAMTFQREKFLAKIGDNMSLKYLSSSGS